MKTARPLLEEFIASSFKHADIKRLFAETEETFGALDVLVNNAGMSSEGSET